MRALGYRTGLYKFAIFCIAGAVAGAAGALWVTQIRFVSPQDLTFLASAYVLVAVIIGGADSLLGGLVGAATIIAVRNLLPTDWEGQGPLVLGALLIVIVYSLRGGVAALPGRLAALRK
jgi:branched-chain amino acid transport system permease protein